ncbi:MAG: hypothetical protein IT184_05635 [Acidobacteria bacterium]|nr:hypothetical protein [Acidobacteriota bacterium]
MSVLDKDRHAVRGLTAKDFSVLEEDHPRPIATFVEVDLPLPEPANTGSSAVAQSDISTARVGRVIVIVIDDNGLGGLRAQQWAILKARSVALNVIANMGPADLGAVIFTADNRTGQPLTRDHALLTAAITNAQPLQLGFTVRPPDVPSCACGICSMETLARVSKDLRSIEGLRKTIFFISQGVPGARGGACEELHSFTEAMRQAQLANVTIHPFDPSGLKVGAAGGRGRGRGGESVRLWNPYARSPTPPAVGR